MLFGVDHIAACTWMQDKRIGMVTNDVACTRAGIPSRVAVMQAGLRLVALFAPEHGLHATLPDGQAVKNTADPLTGKPVYSLYGTHWGPHPEALEGLDIMLFDIPDAGSRFYTYLWTLSHVMECCAAAGLPLVILDRPNPLGGVMAHAEGPWLDENHCSSFIGRWRMPVRHCCTLGELALWFKATRLPQLQVQVVPCSGWQRAHHGIDHDIGFRPTSPAITDAKAALLYAGTALLEGVNVNEGRGTDTPFKILGAPWIHADVLCASLRMLAPPGVHFQPVSYVPAWGCYAGQNCNGISLDITNAAECRPVFFGLTLLHLLAKLFPHNLTEKPYPTAANPAGHNHLDRLTGIPDSFNIICHHGIPDTSVLPAWENQLQPFLMYP